MTSDIQGRLLAVALNSLRSRGKLLSGLRMFLRNAHLGAIIIGHRTHLWSLALSLWGGVRSGERGGSGGAYRHPALAAAGPSGQTSATGLGWSVGVSL